MTTSCEQTFLQIERIRFTGSLNITSVRGKKVLLRLAVASTAGRPGRMNTEVPSLSVGLKEVICLCCQHPPYHNQAWTSTEDCPRFQWWIGARAATLHGPLCYLIRIWEVWHQVVAWKIWLLQRWYQYDWLNNSMAQSGAELDLFFKGSVNISCQLQPKLLPGILYRLS